MTSFPKSGTRRVYHDPQSAGYDSHRNACCNWRVRPGRDHTGACAGRPRPDDGGCRNGRSGSIGRRTSRHQIIGESVYNGTGDDAENIGDVNDIVLGTDGKIEAVVVGVGGFLGIGEKDVAVDFAQLEWAERDGDRWLVAPMTKEQLETQAAFDRSAYEPEQPVASNDPAARAPATTPAGRLVPLPAPDATAEAPADAST